VHQEKAIKITAEAYKIEVVLKYPGEEQDASGVDFGLIKVGWCNTLNPRLVSDLVFRILA